MGKSLDAKRPRACDSCRGLKVKCIIDPASGEPCKRCAKAGRQCIVTPPTRKRQKKADSRVAELERKIDALTATLAQRDGKAPDSYNHLKRESGSYESSPILSRAGDYASSERSGKRPRLEKVDWSRRRLPALDTDQIQPYTNGRNEPTMAGSADNPAMQSTPTGGSIYNQMGPIIYDHSDLEKKLDAIISKDDAERLFNRYVNEVVPHFPAVPFVPGTSAAEIRKDKPILFLAILSGTSYGAHVPDETQKALERELRNVFAECMWKNGERNLQLVQALQVAALWYRPPKNFQQHMFYQMVHMATITAIDIGIGRRASVWSKKYSSKEFRAAANIPDPEHVDSRRAWLVNYYLCVM